MKTRYVLAEYGKVSLETREVPPPGPGQVLLKAVCSSLSPGTERDLLAGKAVPLPSPLGYSMIARIAAVGEGVSEFREGDLVAATAPHADYSVVGAQGCTPCPEDISVEQASLFVLAHTAMYGIRRTRIQLGESVVVLGQGPVGLLAGIFAGLSGARPVIVTNTSDGKLEIAKRLGAHIAINPKTQPDELARVLAELGPGAPAVVLETAGTPDSITQSVQIATERSRVMVLSVIHEDMGSKLGVDEMMRGIFMKGASFIGGYINSKPFSLRRYDMDFPGIWPPVVSKESSRFVCSDIWTSDEDIRTFLSLLQYGLDISPMITHRFSPEQITEAYDMVWNRDKSLIGGVIRWGE